MRRFSLIKKLHEPSWIELDFGRLFERFFEEPFKVGFSFERGPAVNIYEKDNKVIAKIEIPGAKPEDLKLSVDGDLLTVSGERKDERETRREDYYRRESSYGKFQRTVELPASVKAEEARATYKNGILTVELPRAESQRKKEIKIDIN